MLRFQSGDEEAFRELFESYQRSVYFLIFRYFNDSDLAEELTQETFFRVYKARSEYEPKAAFATWVFQIASHLCLNTLRSRRKEVALDIDSGEEETRREFEDLRTPTPDHSLETSEVGRAVAAALQQLPESQRLLILMTYYEDIPIAESARVLGITAVGARLRLMRARNILKKKLHRFDHL